MYAVFTMIPVKDRRRALTFTYTPDVGGKLPRDENHYCPLGHCFEGTRRTPLADDVATIVTGRDQRRKYAKVYHAALQFIDDWDHGRVTNLQEALGL